MLYLSFLPSLEPFSITTQFYNKSIRQFTNLIASYSSPSTNNSLDLSTLYANRGVIYYKQGNNQWALADFQKALQMNYLNYTVYFNIFSLYFSCNNWSEGLKNLCCGLSCLYMIRGRQKDYEADINKCIKLAQNNCQGRLLKALHYHKKNKSKLALNQLKWILQTEHKNRQIMHIINYIQSCSEPQKARYRQNYGDQQENNIYQIQQISAQFQNSKKKSKRLLCTLYDDFEKQQQTDNFDFYEEGLKRLKEFNQIYWEMFGKDCTMHSDDKGNIFLLQGVKNLKQIQKFQSQIKQRLIFEQVKFQQICKEQDNGQSSNLQNSNIQYLQFQQLYNSDEVNTSLHSPQTPTQAPLFTSIGSVDSQLIKSLASNQSPSSPSSSKNQLQNYMRDSIYQMEGLGANRQNAGFITIKAKDDGRKISIKVNRIQIRNENPQNKQITIQQQYNDLYCVFEYGQSKLILLKSTPLQKNDYLNKNQQESKRLKIRVFNKEILQFKDKLLGEGEQEIMQTGTYMISLYSKNRDKEIGSVTLSVKVI